MKSKGYTIKLQREVVGVGYLTYTLANDGQFYAACDGYQAATLERARQRYQELPGGLIRGTDYVYIVGPRSGVHRVGTR